MCGHGSVYRRQEVSEAERINCPKCGTVHDNPRYHDSNWGECGNVECGFNDFSKTSGEHLHRYCKCGYDWTEPIILLREAGTARY